MAHHGTRLAARAEALGLALAFEAAVAGGIPIIKALREGLAGNRARPRLRHPERHLQLHPDDDARERPRIRRGARPRRRSSAMPRPIRASISTASTPRTSWRSWPRRFRPAGRSRRRLCRGHPPRLAPRHRFCRGARLPHQAARHRAADRARPRAARPPVHGAAGDADRGGRGRLQRGRRRGRFRRPGGAAKGAAPAPCRPPRRSSPTSSTSPPGAGSVRSACRLRELRAVPGVPIERHQGAYYIRLMVLDRPGVIADVAAALARRSSLDGIDDPARPRAGRSGAGGADHPCHGRGGDAPGARAHRRARHACSSRRG